MPIGEADPVFELDLVAGGRQRRVVGVGGDVIDVIAAGDISSLLRSKGLATASSVNDWLTRRFPKPISSTDTAAGTP